MSLTRTISVVLPEVLADDVEYYAEECGLYMDGEDLVRDSVRSMLIDVVAGFKSELDDAVSGYMMVREAHPETRRYQFTVPESMAVDIERFIIPFIRTTSTRGSGTATSSDGSAEPGETPYHSFSRKLPGIALTRHHPSDVPIHQPDGFVDSRRVATLSESGNQTSHQTTRPPTPCGQITAIAQGQRSLIVNRSAVLPSARSEDPSRNVTAIPASVEATAMMSAIGRLLSPMVISDPEILSLETMLIKDFSKFK